MGKLVSIVLDPALVADYERLAGERGRSLEAEFAEALAAHRPKPKLSRAELVARVHENWANALWETRLFGQHCADPGGPRLAMIVVDATVAVKLLVQEPGADQALARVELDDDRVAPTWIRIEVTNALVKKVRLNELTRGRVLPAPRSLHLIMTRFVDSSRLVDPARELALDAGHPVYDCLYLALAVERRSVVVTHDKGFAAAAKRIGLASHVELLAP